jgi:hypothetical protein
MQTYYYPRTTRKVLIAFLDMWNSIQVYNYSSATSSEVVNIIDVPIKFGPADKAYLFNVQQESGKKFYQKVPSMAVSIGNFSYNASRATSVNELREFYDANLDISNLDNFWQDVMPSPYDLTFNLDVYTESIDHLFQIFEQILPFFNPTNYLRIKEFDFLNLERDLRVEMNSVDIEYPQTMSEEEYRYYIGKISFTVYTYMYRPLDYSGIIKFINSKYYYDEYNKETFSTSGLPSSATPPLDYNWKFNISTSGTGYTEVSD